MEVTPPLTPESRQRVPSFSLVSPGRDHQPQSAVTIPPILVHAHETRFIPAGGSQARPLVLSKADTKRYQLHVVDPATVAFSGERGISVRYDSSPGSCSTSMGINLKLQATGQQGVQCSRPVEGQISGAWLRVVLRIAVIIKSALWVLGTALVTSTTVLIAFWSLFPICTRCRDRAGDLSRIEGSGLASSTKEAMGLAAAPEINANSTLRINQLQVIGTHNSYHRRSRFPGVSEFWPYHFPSLTEQLDGGVRHLELDVHYDWKTGSWFVYHVSVVDPVSTCHCLSSCLEEIRQWSDAHPTHHILFMDIELKVTGDFLQICGKSTPEMDKAAFLSLQNTILATFPRDRVLTPKTVRGDYDTVLEAVQGMGDMDMEMKGGWPLVDDTRGMILFVLDYQSINIACREGVREALPDDDTAFFERIPDHEMRKSRSPYAAFTQLCQCNDIWRQRTTHLVRDGFIVRQVPKDWTNAGPTSRRLRGSSHATTKKQTYLADTPAQLLVSDDLSHTGPKGECRSRIFIKSTWTIRPLGALFQVSFGSAES